MEVAMDRCISFPTIVLLMISFVAGCSGEGSGPVLPTPDDSQVLTAETNMQGNSRTVLWGYYDLHFDFENETVDIVPNRRMMYTVNIVKFMNSNPAGLTISDFNASPQPDYIAATMDITITHPLDDEKFNGYDVRGIFIGNGSATLPHFPDISIPGDGDQFADLDGYTRWFNPTEFGSPSIFGYTPGLLAPTGYTGTSMLNPYRYFAEGFGPGEHVFSYLDDADPQNGYFLHGTSNTRDYQIRFPIPAPGIKYGYAITANWAGGDPSDHPAFAPESLGVLAAIGNDAYYVDPSDNGGYVDINISLFDRSSGLTAGVMEDYQITIDSTIFSAPYALNALDMTPYMSDGQWHTYWITIPADNLTKSGSEYVWIIVEYPGYDYSNPFGMPNDAETEPLVTYYKQVVLIDVTPPTPSLEINVPNGGEIYNVGELTEIFWSNTDHAGKVDFYYYKDDDPSTLYTIEENVADTGVHVWEVPDDQSHHVRMRVASQLYPGLYDDSAEFSIVQPHITVTSPNGGEEWEAGTSQDITWTSDGFAGPVDIHYSKDNFVAEEIEIETDLSNTGSYNWVSIPDDPSPSVRVRVRSTSYDTIFDVSDANFTIEEAVTGWAHSDGAEYEDIAYGVIRDGQDNAYLVGTRGLTVDSGGILQKYNETGLMDEIFWTAVENFDDVICKDIAIEPGGNIFIVGGFEGTVDFDTGTGTAYGVSSGGSDAFMVEYGIDLVYQDHWVWGGSGDQIANGIDIDSSFNKYVTGSFQGSSIDFDPGTGTDPHNTHGLYDVFVSKFGSNEAHLWTQTWGGTGNDYGKAVVSDGSVYVAGDFENTVDFDPSGSTLEYTSEGFSDIFLSSFTSTGDYNWAVAWGGLDIDYGEDVDTDLSGNVFVAGGFTDVVDFDPDPVGEEFFSASGFDAYISRFSSSGNYQFALTWSGSGAWEIAYGITINPSNIVYVTGQAYASGGASVDMDPFGGGDMKPAVGAFLSKFDGSGVYYWSRTWGSGLTGTETTGYGVHYADEGAVFVVGAFDGTSVEFAPTGDPCFNHSDLLHSLGGLDTFIAKYRSDGCW